MRGGIIDVFSYSSEYPLRIDLFGNKIESIRTFDPETQLSKKSIQRASILPNTHTKLLKEERISFLDYLSKDTLVWIKDLKETKDIIAKAFEKAVNSFQDILSISDNTQVIQSPSLLYETSKSFTSNLKRRKIIEFGKRSFYLQLLKSIFETNHNPIS